MSAPFSRSITAISYWLCKSSQNCAWLPKYRPSRTAVSALIERRPLRMSVMRPDGTPRSSARRLALSARAASSRLSSRPGCARGAWRLSSVIVDELDVVGIALTEFETDTPSLIHGHGPLSIALSLEPMQANAAERAEIAQRLGDVQSQQQIDGNLDIQSAKLVRPLAFPDLA